MYKHSFVRLILKSRKASWSKGYIIEAIIQEDHSKLYLNLIEINLSQIFNLVLPTF